MQAECTHLSEYARDAWHVRSVRFAVPSNECDTPASASPEDAGIWDVERVPGVSTTGAGGALVFADGGGASLTSSGSIVSRSGCVVLMMLCGGI